MSNERSHHHFSQKLNSQFPNGDRTCGEEVNVGDVSRQAASRLRTCDDAVDVGDVYDGLFGIAL
ncbi:hypothetical protein [Nostoc sp. 'Peltigera malacea cyanobiont' DB3992]|uniref:hypothetical protein n=1 Tax=Nostoc sp. 'Peltigera malacea cyanobiont' DB3992 TaxID=1206980 RepID=UPI00117D7290|nr:hypothetical protein [Nostoc sp. 'Peltigera malacea cyanobiont' DB3992]